VVRDHRGDHLVVVLRLVERAGKFGLDAPRGAIKLKLSPLFRLHDRGVADRPDVLDAVNAGIGRGDGIPRMSGRAHAEFVRLVGRHRDQVGREKFAELERVVAVPLLGTHDVAGRLGVGNLHVIAPAARPLTFEFGRAITERLTCRPNARSADLAVFGAVLLGQRPRAVLLGFDLDAGGDAEVQIQLAPKRFPMAMAVDEAWHDRLAADVDHARARRNRDLPAAANVLETVSFDDNDGILDRRPAGAIDQRAAPDDEGLRVRARDCAESCREGAQRQRLS
jgi:hypothetical protein